MTCREKKRRRQQERDEKLADDILSGRAVYVQYEDRKRRAQRNRKGGAVGGSGEADEMAEKAMGIVRVVLPGILSKLARIDDYRDTRKIIHSVETLMFYGILMFLCNIGSCRESNRQLGGEDSFMRLQQIFPELATVPHADTLKRFLSATDTEIIQSYYEEMLAGFLKSGAFRRLNPGRFLVFVDGSGKFSRHYNWDSHALSRHEDDPDKATFHAYMLDSFLMLENGMVLPLITEQVSNGPNGHGSNKQDCEQGAFHRMAVRLERLLGKGRVELAADGLYACGPVIAKCNSYGWDYMLGIKSDSMSTVWDDFYGLCQAAPENSLVAKHGERAQSYAWANDIEYTYGGNNKKLRLNLVTCHEKWIEDKPRSGGVPVKMKTTYAWLSGKKLNDRNVFERCTRIGRARWWAESCFYIEKNQGYSYSHCFSYNWGAMMGFHYLMKIAHFINIITAHCKSIAEYVVAEGIQGFIKKIWEIAVVRGVIRVIHPPKGRGRPPAAGIPDYLSLCLDNFRY